MLSASLNKHSGMGAGRLLPGTGAVHPSNRKAGVLRGELWEDRNLGWSREQSSFVLDFQYEYRPCWGVGWHLTIFLTLWVLSRWCQKSVHWDNWLVMAQCLQ